MIITTSDMFMLSGNFLFYFSEICREKLVKCNLCNTIVNLLQTDDKCVHTDTVLDMLINMSEWGKYAYRQIGHFPFDLCR